MSTHRATKARKPRLSDGQRHPVITIVGLWYEVAITDTCRFGCKVLARKDKPEVTRVFHSKVYGCTHKEAK
jgi:hypothetical protein